MIPDPVVSTHAFSTSTAAWQDVVPDAAMSTYVKQEPGINTTPPTKRVAVCKRRNTRTQSKRRSSGQGGQKGVVNALAKLQKHRRVTDAPRKQVAALTGMKLTSFNVLLSHMKKKGLVECRTSDTVRLTQEGKDMANVDDDTTPLPDTAAVHDDIKRNVLSGTKMLEIFDYLADGKVHKKADVMQAIGYTNKNSFSVLMSNTKSKTGVLEYPDNQSVRLTDMCFPFGRP